ncbi:ethanolamine ammonia-lyase subunit EutB [Desulfitibacter alkalitolerans]|uniref:ethanolamine ammonia-lyase subunit EutB n=1 Tax=Desulfitibacter alkalitolerans TaxID=264641 RepID=UPI000488CEA5|nr:ethanolamine ammonia-lyase subunit EutB [Desulfitibacter alkalitolerans]
MKLKTRLFGTNYQFKSVKEVLAKANEERSGDTMLGIGAASMKERVAAKVVLSELTLEDIRKNPVIPYEEDEVTRVIEDMVNETIYNEIKNWTVGYLREWVLDYKTTDAEIKRVAAGLTPEMVAGTAKLMSNMDLVYAPRKIIIETKANYTIGRPGTLSFRIQPNHPSDSVDGILLAVMEALTFGCGDAQIGVNPNEDTVEVTKRLMHGMHDFMIKWNIPTHTCILSHITNQMRAVEEGAPVSLFFQSIAGTEDANKTFGLSMKLLDEATEIIKHKGTAAGPNLWYFETGQGAEMSLGTDHGVDQLTLEARKYGFARRYAPFSINTVTGFIGPEVTYDGKQMIRGVLEDHFCGKMLGMPLGMGCVYTNHAKLDINDQETATMLTNLAGANYFIGVPMGDDVMLSYQDTSYHDNATLREMLGRKPAKEFHQWMIEMGFMDEDGHLTSKAGDPSVFIK